MQIEYASFVKLAEVLTWLLCMYVFMGSIYALMVYTYVQIIHMYYFFIYYSLFYFLSRLHTLLQQCCFFFSYLLSFLFIQSTSRPCDSYSCQNKAAHCRNPTQVQVRAVCGLMSFILGMTVENNTTTPRTRWWVLFCT